MIPIVGVVVPLVWMASKSRLSSWILSHSGWDHTHILSVHIWMVGSILVITVGRCCLVYAAWHKDGI
jgi:hypothetical protein